MILPPEAIPLLAEFSPAFTEPTYRRFVTRLLAAVLIYRSVRISTLLRCAREAATTAGMVLFMVAAANLLIQAIVVDGLGRQLAAEFLALHSRVAFLFVSIGVSSILGTTLVTMALYIVAAISGWIGPLLTPRIGHKGIGIAGFGIVFVSLVAMANGVGPKLAARIMAELKDKPIVDGAVVGAHTTPASGPTSVGTAPTLVTATVRPRRIASAIATP